MSTIEARNFKKAAAGIAILLLLFLVGGMALSDDATPAAADGDPAADVECATTVHFYAADVEQNFYGPAADGNIDQLNEEHRTRRCVDPAMVVGDAHAWGVPGFKELNGDAQFAAKIRELRDNPELWRSTIDELERVESESTVSIEAMSGSYQTLYMIDGVTDVPLIRKDVPDRPSFEVLRFDRGNGQVVNFKLDCGFQPVAQDFPGIPPVKTPPPTSEPPPTTAPPTTQPPRTTTTTRPPGTTTTTRPVPKCPDGSPVPPNGLCPKNPEESVNNNPDVPDQVKKTEPSPDNQTEANKPPREPVDSPTGCTDRCDEDDGFAPTTTTTRPNQGQGDSGDGATNVTTPPTTQAPAPAPPTTASPSPSTTNPPPPPG